MGKGACKIVRFFVYREAIIELQAKRRGWLILIAGVHALALLSWRSPERVLAPPAPPGPGITYILPPFTPPPSRLPQQRPHPPAPTPQPRAVASLPAPQPQPAPAMQLVTPPPSPPSPPPEARQAEADPFAQPAKPDDSLKQRALLSAAAADKQLRKEAWNPRDKKIANDSTYLAAAISSAYVGHESGVTTEQIILPDGRLMTKVHTPAGTFCAQMESNTLTGGRDPFRDGLRTLIGKCP